MNISACVITKNEENNIENYLNKIKPFVSEIVVVDTGSTDSTVVIAKKFGARVYQVKWEDDFSEAKNFAISKATGQWIVFLDADEYFANESYDSIKKIIQIAEKSNLDAILGSIINYDSDEGIVISNASSLRIFRKDINISYVGAIHETITRTNGNLKWMDARKVLSIIHTGYTRSEIVKKDKGKRNVNLLLKELSKHPNKSDICFYLSEAYMISNELQLSLFYGLKLLEINNSELNIYEKNYGNVIRCMQWLKYPESQIITLILEAHSQYPNYPDFGIYLAEYYDKNFRYFDAIDLYISSLKIIEDDNNQSLSESLMKSQLLKIYSSLSKIYVKTNQLNQAVSIYVKLLKYNKYDLKSLDALLSLLFRHESEEEILKLLLKIYNAEDIKDATILFKFSVKNNNVLLAKYFETSINDKETIEIDNCKLLLLNGNYKEAANKYSYYISNVQAKHKENYIIYAFISFCLTNNMELIKNLSDNDHDLKLYRSLLLRENIHEFETEKIEETILKLFKEFVDISQDSLIQEYIDFIYDFNLFFDLAEIYFHQGKYKNAFEYYKLFVEENPNVEEILLGDVLYKICDCLNRIGNLEIAREFLYDAISICPSDYKIYSLGIQIALGLEDEHVLIDIIKKAIAIFPESNYFKALYKELVKENQSDELIHLKHKTSYELHLNNLHAYFNEALNLISNNRDKEAKQLLLLLSNYNQISAVCCFKLGEIYNREQDITNSIKFHNKAFEIDPMLAKRILKEDHPVYNYKYDSGAQSLLECCPLCNLPGNKHSCYNTITSIDFLAGFDPIRVWMFCEECNHLYANKVPENLSAILSGSSFDFNMTPKTGFLPQIGDIVGNIKKYASGNRFLEVGVGAGEMTAIAKEYLFEVSGIDIRPSYAKNISRLLNIPIFCVDFIEFNSADKFDVICIGDVIEHMLDPQSALKKAYELLNSNGVLWISTPNFESGFSMIKRDQDPMWRIIEHINYFSFRSLKKILEQNNFEIVDYKVSSHYNGSMEVTAIKK